MKYKVIWLQVFILAIGTYCLFVPYKRQRIFVDQNTSRYATIESLYGIPTSLSPVVWSRDQSLVPILGMYLPTGNRPVWILSDDLRWKYPFTKVPAIIDEIPGHYFDSALVCIAQFVQQSNKNQLRIGDEEVKAIVKTEINELLSSNPGDWHDLYEIFNDNLFKYPSTGIAK